MATRVQNVQNGPKKDYFRLSHVRFLLLAFGALGRKSQRAQKGELCAAALAEVASLGVGRGSLIFSRIFFDACFAVYDARRLLGSKTWISATLHRQGPRMVSDSRKCLF
jgi:hypothetical protein